MRLSILLCFLATLYLSACASDSSPARPTSTTATQPQSQTHQPTVEPAAPQQQQQQRGDTPSRSQPASTQQSEQPETSSQDLLSDQSGQQSDDSSPGDESSSEPAAPSPSFSYESVLPYLNHLAVEIGPRASGTDQELAAAQYLLQQFQALGYDAEFQDLNFSQRVRWTRVDIGPRSAAVFHFAGSSEQLASGELVAVNGYGAPEDFATVDVNGRIAVVDRGLLEFRVKAANAQAAGATALIILNTSATGSLTGTLGADTFDIPIMLASFDDAATIRNAIGDIAAIQPLPPAVGTSQNVIARKADGVCRVVVGGHYDTVPTVDGANDNASGTALTLALAESWADHPAAAHICFAAFGAEEVGLVGSRAYVRMLTSRGELGSVTAMLNLDAIGDGTAPVLLTVSPELSEMALNVAQWLGVDARRGQLSANFGSDHQSFDEAGIPVIFPFPPGAIIHTPLDRLDQINHDIYSDISTLSHHLLACLLERAGSPIVPAAPCVRN